MEKIRLVYTALTTMARGLTGFALLGGQPEDRSAARPAVQDAAAACQPAPTIPTVVRGRKTYVPSQARLGPIRTGAYAGRPARLPVSRARASDDFLGKLFVPDIGLELKGPATRQQVMSIRSGPPQDDIEQG